MSEKEVPAPLAGGDDNNKPESGDAPSGTSTKSKSARRREQAKRAKARAQAAALAATVVPAKPTLSTFVGDDADLPSLDYSADVAIRYRHFKEEMSRHAGKNRSSHVYCH